MAMPALASTQVNDTILSEAAAIFKTPVCTTAEEGEPIGRSTLQQRRGRKGVSRF
jgi:hypothetical protein